MSTKIVKKTKIKVYNLLIVLLILVGLFFGVQYLIKAPVRNYIFRGTTYMSDDTILNQAGIKNYPPFLTLSGKETCSKITKSPYIDSCKIQKKWGFILEFNLEENKPLFYDVNQKKYIFQNEKGVEEDSISKNFRVPRLLNYVPDKKFTKFVLGMSKVDQDTLSKISDIEYQPNDYDKDRFLLYMDDGNMVYLTLTKFKMINHYNEVLTQLEGHHGILYLDSGNHFKIME